MATLSPAWRPIITEGECAPFGTPLFQPAFSLSHGVLVAGGPLQLHIFRILNNQELWFSIPARFWISGFDLQGGSLYVQDGPVLSGWDLRNGGSFGAVNLVSREQWKVQIPPRTGVSASPVMLPNPPDEVYEIDDDHARQHADLMKVRRAAAWATVLEAADDLKSLGQSAIVPLDKHIKLGQLIGRGSVMRGSREIQEMYAAVDAVMGNASDRFTDTSDVSEMVFSAPVVRREQMRGQGMGEVFVLGQNGMLYGMDSMFATGGSAVALEHRPARAQLAMAEVPNATGGKDCRLYYVTAGGGIAAVNASRSTPELMTGWEPAGPLQLDRLLPLQYADGKLFGGGIFNADFFVRTTDPKAPPLLTAYAPPRPSSAFSYGRGWVDFDIAPDDELVILNNGCSSCQMSYAANARERRRGEFSAVNPIPRTYSLFWPGTGRGPRPASQPLLLEVFGRGLDVGTIMLEAFGPGGHADNPRLGVFLANTLDSQDPERTPHFPPASIELTSDNLAIGQWTNALSRIAWIRCKPVVVQQMMYCAARSTTIPEYLSSFDAALWQRAEAAAKPYLEEVARKRAEHERVQDAKKARGEAVEPFRKDPIHGLGNVPLPPLPGNDALVAFALSPTLANAQKNVEAGVNRIANTAKPYGPPR